MHGAPKRVGPCSDFIVFDAAIHVLGHHFDDDGKLGLPFLGKGWDLGMIVAGPEHHGKDTGLRFGKVDIRPSKSHDPFGVTSGICLRRGLHRGAHPMHRLKDHRVQDLFAILEVLVGRGGTDARHPTSLGDREAVWAFFFDQIPHSFQKLRPQLAVMVIIFLLGQLLTRQKLASLTFFLA